MLYADIQKKNKKTDSRSKESFPIPCNIKMKKFYDNCFDFVVKKCYNLCELL